MSVFITCSVRLPQGLSSGGYDILLFGGLIKQKASLCSSDTDRPFVLPRRQGFYWAFQLTAKREQQHAQPG